LTDYSSRYSGKSFWAKCRKVAKAAGAEVIEKALWLYFALQRKETPVWAKATIIGALGYFIFPVDAIPDFIPVAGYSDDVGVLAAAVTSVAMYIDKDVKAKASEKLADWDLA
jgi:uncharacterized membrane protein YkvA (DUF1232 family)